MFIVLAYYRESLREMMSKGLANKKVKIKVLEMLKQLFCDGRTLHVGIKDILIHWLFDKFSFKSSYRFKYKPESILVDYNDRGGSVTDFGCFLADWETATDNYGKTFYGGTPFYAAPFRFETFDKDLFSFGRLALELFFSEQGLSHEIIDQLIT